MNKSQFEVEILERRESELWDRIESLENRVASVEHTDREEDGFVVPGISNFVRNSDGNYTQEGMAGATFANKAKVAAHWYTLQSGTTTQLSEHTTTVESTHGLMESTHPSYGTPACDWDKAGGVFRLGGGYSLIHPLTKNLVLPGYRIYVQALMKLGPGVSVTSTHQVQASLFENLGAGSRRIIEATPWNVVLTPVGGTGSTTRKYVVEIITTNGTSRSNVTDITNSVATLSATQYIALSWQTHLGIIKINIYRSNDGGATYQRLTGSSGLTGGTSWYDTGVAGTTVTLPSASNQKAYARALVSEVLTTEWQKVTFAIPVPPYYTMLGSSDKQMLELNIVDSSGTAVSTTSLGVLVDKVGVSYNNGIYSPSAEDLTTAATVQVTNPDPGIGPPGGGSGDPGDGAGTCIVLETPVLMADGLTKPAGEVQEGDWIKVLNLDTRKLENAEVSKVLRGSTHSLLIEETENSRLSNNPPHKLITPYNWLGQSAVSLTLGSTIIVAGYIDGKETVLEKPINMLRMLTSEEPIAVVTFHVNHPSKNYIAGYLKNGVGGPVSHNLKRQQ